MQYPNHIQAALKLPATATAHRPVAWAPGTLGQQLALASTAAYLSRRRQQTRQQVWQDARCLVIPHVRQEAEA